jgi:hypothetical protein
MREEIAIVANPLGERELTMTDSKLQIKMEELINEFGEQAVRNIILGAKIKRERVKESPGAPPIDRKTRDAFIFVLVDLVRYGKNKNSVAWCCEWIAKQIHLELRANRKDDELSRRLDNANTIRRIYSRTKKQYQSSDDFRWFIVGLSTVFLTWNDKGAEADWNLGLEGTYIQNIYLRNKASEAVSDGISKCAKLFGNDLNTWKWGNKTISG